jgi:hypothetical protein
MNLTADQVEQHYQQVRQSLMAADFDAALATLGQMVVALGKREWDESFILLSNNYRQIKLAKINQVGYEQERENQVLLRASTLAYEVKQDFLARLGPVPDPQQEQERALQEKVRALEAQIGQLVAEKLSSGLLPPNYQREVSAEQRLSFGYPGHWTLERNREFMYAQAIDYDNAERLGFARNMNIMVAPGIEIDAARVSHELDQLAIFGKEQLGSIFQQLQLLDSGPFQHRGLPAFRCEYAYATTDGCRLYLYQAYLYDPQGQRLFTFSFTTTLEDAPHSQPEFENIVATFQV